MITLALSILASIPFASAAEPINPAYDALKLIKNDIPRNSRRGVAEVIMNCANKLSVPWQDILAVAKVESNLKPLSVRKIKNRSVDHGLFQINVLSIKEHKFDNNKILDPIYNAKAACKVIGWVKSIKPNWIGYYNVGPHSKKHKRRLAYENKVTTESAKIRMLFNEQILDLNRGRNLAYR